MITIGIIGAGRIGQVHVNSIRTGVPGARVKAIADPFITEETKNWVLNAGVEKVCLDYRQILDDPEIDAVLICSSTDTHCAVSLDSISANKHILCEKPIDHDVDNIKAVMQALEGKKLKYQVGFQRRFDHNWRSMRNAVTEGLVGDVHLVRIPSRDPAPTPIDYIKVSGGMFMDMMSHDFDLVRYLSGMEPEEVSAKGAVLVDSTFGQAGDIDTAIVTLKLQGGALAVIDASRKSGYGYDQRGEVHGSKGLVSIANEADSTAVISNDSGILGRKPLHFFLERYMAAYQAEIGAFVDAIRNDTAVEVGINDGLQPVLIAIAAKKSMLEGRSVRLSEVSI